jgi:hypothetical protein
MNVDMRLNIGKNMTKIIWPESPYCYKKKRYKVEDNIPIYNFIQVHMLLIIAGNVRGFVHLGN